MRFIISALLSAWVVAAMKLPYHLDKSGLKIDFLNEPKGCDNPVKIGDIVIVDFEGFFEDGTELPVVQKGTYEFQVGITDVIRGWSLGVQGMCVDEIRKLTIPPHLAYGDKGAQPVIPGGTTLIFDVHLKSVVDGFKDIMIDVPLKGGEIDDEGLADVLMNFLKTQLTKHRRGSFINDGVRYTT